MSGYPAGVKARKAQRAEIDRRVHRQADAEAARLGRSLNCGEYGWHAGQDGGCANDGSTCLCACHDKADDK